MRKRTIVALLLACLALAGVTALVRLAGPSSAIEIARRKCGALTVGMTEAEFGAALGALPGHKGKLYGYWMEDRQWYATRDPRLGPSNEPGSKLYDWRQWNFESRGAWSFEDFYVGALLDEGRVVCFWSGEYRENAAEQWLKGVGRRLSLDLTVLSHRRSGPSQACKPSP